MSVEDAHSPDSDLFQSVLAWRGCRGQRHVLICRVRPHVHVYVAMRAPLPLCTARPSLSRPKTHLSPLVEKRLVPLCSSISWRCTCDELWMTQHVWNHKEIQFKFLHTVQSPLCICPMLTSIVHLSKFCRGMISKCWGFASGRYWLILFVAFCRERHILVFHFPLSVCESVYVCVFNIQKH